MKIKHTSQQYDSETINPSIKFLKNAATALKSLSDGERKVLSIFRNMGNYKRIYFRQTWLAQAANLSRGRVNVIIKKFSDLGLIAKKYRHMNTSNYRVSDFLLNPSPAIKKILLLICIFSSEMLMSRPFRPPFNISYRKEQSIIDIQISTKNRITHTKLETIKNKSDTLNSRVNIYINPSIINGRCTKEKMLSFKKEDFIHPIISSSLSYLNLSWDQKFKLSIFPATVLNYAFTRLKYGPSNKNSYNWFKFFCEEYCKEKKLKPDFRFYYQLVDVYGTDTPKKERVEMKSISQPVAYSYKLPAGYLAVRKENPLYVFDKQYRFMLDQGANSPIPPHCLWEMGVAKFVKNSFYGYLGQTNMCPDLVLAHIDSLIGDSSYQDIVNAFGLEVAKKFIELCIESVLEEQRYTLNEMKMSCYGKNKLSLPDSTQLVLNEHILLRTKNVDEFLRSDSYEYISQLVGEETMKSYIYLMVQNWMQIMQ